MLTSAGLLSSYRHGYESKFSPMYNYNHDLSECKTDLDCETTYQDYKNDLNVVIVTNHEEELYNGQYE